MSVLSMRTKPIQAQIMQKMKDIGLDKKNILALNCKYYLTHQF